MNKKFSVLFIGLMIACLSLSLVNFKSVNAESYYNWVLGSDMETSTNYIEDNGFESGAFNSGVQYGNWSELNAITVFNNVKPRTGVYCLEIQAAGRVAYNLTDAILGANIEEFSWWNINSHGAGSYDLDVWLNYSDGSFDYIEVEVGNIVWSSGEHENIVSNVNDAKYLVAFTLDSQDTNMYLDDFFLGVVDEYSQEQYSFDTYPWRTTGLLGYWQSIGYTDFPTLLPFLNYRMYPTGAYVDVDMIGHNLIWGRNSNGSGYIGYDESTAQFVQDFNYLDSDSVHFIDLWAYTTSSESVGVKINIIYSDRSYDTKTMNVTEVSTWEHLNFGKSWIDSNKYIIQIQISLANYFAGYVNIDDIGIWSSLPSNSYRFTFNISPSPISQTPIGFNVYMEQVYTFTGYLWDSNNELTENGTVTVSHNYGITTATLSNGIFNFSIAKRSGASDFTEQFGINVNTGENVELYELTVNWIYIGGGGGGGGEDEERAGNLTDWIIMFCVIFLPALLFAGSLYENNQQPDAFHISPVFGIIGGLVLSVGLGVYTALVPLWMLVLMIIAVVVLIVGLVKH